MVENNKTFVRITNVEIYRKLCDIEKHVIKTNGKVKINRWIASTALTLFLAIFLNIVGGKINCSLTSRN